MAQVTFPPELGGDGKTYSDDSNPTTGLGNGGHRTRFVPALGQGLAMAATARTKAGEAFISAQNAATSETNAIESANAALAQANRAEAEADRAQQAAIELDIVPQAEAEAGTATTRRVWTAERVRQAIAAWWNTIGTAFGKTLLESANATAARNTLGLEDAVLRQDLSGNPSDGEGATLVKGAVIALDATENLSTLPLSDGDVVETKGYYAAGDAGGGTFDINTDTNVDGYSSFDLGAGLYAHLRHDGLITSAQFGVMPDGVTNWEGSQGNRMKALYQALHNGIEVRFVRRGSDVLYSTGMNIFNQYQGWTMSFDEGVEFGNIFHIISSGTPIFDREVSVVSGTNPTITFAVAHGISAPRYMTFEGTGTNLDGNSYLVTSTGATTATVEATVSGSGTGTASDTPIKNITLKGTYTTYDRFGLINVHGLKADTIVCKSDPSKHTTGRNGRGVHVYTNCKDFDVRQIIVEETADQAESVNMHAAIAFDGVGLENHKVGKMWVKDCRVNGVLLAGENYQVGQIIVNAYGRGVMSSDLPYVGRKDLFGVNSFNLAHGVWFARASGRVEYISVDQANGFSSRAYAQKDVCFDQDYLRWDTLSQQSFVDEKRGMSVGHIECLNPQYVGVDFGPYDNFCSVSVERISFGVISDNNVAVISQSNEFERGLVNIGRTEAKIGMIHAANIKTATLVRHNAVYNETNMGRVSNIEIGTVTALDHGATVVGISCPHDIGAINLRAFTDAGTRSEVPSIDITNRCVNSNINRIHARKPAAGPLANKRVLRYRAAHSNINSLFTKDYAASAAHDSTVTLEGKYCNVGAVHMSCTTRSSVSVGLKYTNSYSMAVKNAEVREFNLGVANGAGNTRINAISCIAADNNTDSDLPVAQLSVDLGNFRWTV